MKLRTQKPTKARNLKRRFCERDGCDHKHHQQLGCSLLWRPGQEEATATNVTVSFFKHVYSRVTIQLQLFFLIYLPCSDFFNHLILI